MNSPAIVACNNQESTSARSILAGMEIAPCVILILCPRELTREHWEGKRATSHETCASPASLTSTVNVLESLPSLAFVDRFAPSLPTFSFLPSLRQRFLRFLLLGNNDRLGVTEVACNTRATRNWRAKKKMKWSRCLLLDEVTSIICFVQSIMQ